MAPSDTGHTEDSPRIKSSFEWVKARRRTLGVVAGAFAVLLALSSGLYSVKLGETSVLRRLGALKNDNIRPGLRYRVPFGIDKTDILETETVRTMFVTIGSDRMALTGDLNLLGVNTVTHYRIDDAGDYIFSAEDPAVIIEKIIRAELFNVMSAVFVDMLLTTDKAYVQRRVLERLQERIDAMGLGVEALNFNLLDVEPPPETAAAFRSVSDALVDRSRMKFDARSRSNTLISRTRGEAERLVDDSSALATERVVQAESDARVFLKMLDQYSANPGQVQTSAYWNRLSPALARARIVVVEPGDGSDIGINLFDSAASIMSGMAEKSHPAAAAGMAGSLDRAIHSGITNDRMPGYGGHRESSEAHPASVPQPSRYGTDLSHIILPGKGSGGARAAPPIDGDIDAEDSEDDGGEVK